jgi:phosphatidylinositol alpha-mannosyltransferase
VGEAALRVALVCPYSLSRPGGVQGQVLGLARSLDRLGHRVVVFAPSDRAVDLPDGVEVVVTGSSTSLRANGSVAPVSVSPAAARRGLAALRATAPDVIHVHEPFAPGLTYAILTARGLAPVVGTFHRSGHSVLYTVLGPLARRLAGRLAARCAVSEAAAATATAALGGSYEVLFNGVEVDRFDGVEPWTSSGPTGLFLGRHEERKGLAVLLEAWQILAGRSATEARPVLWVAGDGPATGALRARYPDSETVRWLGVVSEEEKVARLVAADVLAAPALGGESFGMVLLEAMAARTVVVASDIDGYRDAAGGCAVLAPPDDAPAWASALAGVLDGSLAAGGSSGGGAAGGRQAWLAAGAARAAGWSMASLAEHYERRYRAVVVEARA